MDFSLVNRAVESALRLLGHELIHLIESITVYTTENGVTLGECQWRGPLFTRVFKFLVL